MNRAVFNNEEKAIAHLEGLRQDARDEINTRFNSLLLWE